MTGIRINRSIMLQLALASSASLLELGPVLSILQRGGSLTTVLLIALAYQCGNALSSWVPDSRFGRLALLLTGIALFLAGPEEALAPATLLLSLALQMCRRQVVADDEGCRVPTAMKRSARVAGFLMAPLVPLMAAMCLPALLSMYRKTSDRPSRVEEPNIRRHALLRLMVIHQIHYFLYAYAVLSLVFKSSEGSAVLCAIVFALGWITYLSAERLWGTWPSKTVFICGHVFVAGCLLAMYFARSNTTAWSLLWVLTGFGGGSVYCLTRLLRVANVPESNVARAEDAGHVAGVAAAIGLVAAWRFDEASLCIVASTMPFTAAILMFFHSHADQSMPLTTGETQ